ncbi:MAG: hypothetical protein ACO1OC_10370 [Tuberibacillus sp.]
MDEKLRHLKESMDRTVLRNGAFRNEEKRNILLAIQKQKKMEARRRSRLRISFSLAAAFCLVIGLSWAVFSHFQNQPNNIAYQSNSVKSSEKKDKNTQEKATDADTFAATDTVENPTPFKYDKENDVPDYTYVIFNQYFYKETGKTITKDQLGQQIGRVKRMGVWAEHRSGDSNEIPPGVIYAIHGMDPAIYIAAKGPIMQDGQMQSGYLVLKKFEPVH